MATEPTEQDQEQAVAIFERVDSADCEWCGALCPDDLQDLLLSIATALHEREEQTRKEVWKQATEVASRFADANKRNLEEATTEHFKSIFSAKLDTSYQIQNQLEAIYYATKG